MVYGINMNLCTGFGYLHFLYRLLLRYSASGDTFWIDTIQKPFFKKYHLPDSYVVFFFVSLSLAASSDDAWIFCRAKLPNGNASYQIRLI